jgi:hypothetical protein
MIRGVVFIVTHQPKGTGVPWPSVELEAGVTRSRLPMLKEAELRDLFEMDVRIRRACPLTWRELACM